MVLFSKIRWGSLHLARTKNRILTLQQKVKRNQKSRHQPAPLVWASRPFPVTVFLPTVSRLGEAAAGGRTEKPRNASVIRARNCAWRRRQPPRSSAETAGKSQKLPKSSAWRARSRWQPPRSSRARTGSRTRPRGDPARGLSSGEARRRRALSPWSAGCLTPTTGCRVATARVATAKAATLRGTALCGAAARAARRTGSPRARAPARRRCSPSPRWSGRWACPAPGLWEMGRESSALAFALRARCLLACQLRSEHVWCALHGCSPAVTLS